MNYEEAKKKLEDYKNSSLGFCPVINAHCRKDCVDYNKAYIQEIQPGSYSFYREHCSHPFISGEIGTY